MYGLHLTDTWAGRVFSQAVTPLGAALPIYSATAIGDTGICALPLFNPPGSNRMVELISLDLDWASGTSAFSSVGIMGLPLTSVATGALCTVFTTSTPTNNLLGSGTASRVQSYNGAAATSVTVTAGVVGAPSAAAPGWIRSLASINLEANTGTAHGTSISTYNFNGTVLVPEGYMIYFAGGKATVSLYAATLVWKEIPANLNAA